MNHDPLNPRPSLGNPETVKGILTGFTMLTALVVLAMVYLFSTLGLLSLFASMIPTEIRQSDTFVKAILLGSFVLSAATIVLIRLKWGDRWFRTKL